MKKMNKSDKYAVIFTAVFFTYFGFHSIIKDIANFFGVH